MKTENILLLGGLAFVGYWLFKKYKPKTIDVTEPQMLNTTNNNNQEPKTIILDLKNNRMSRTETRQAFLSPFHKGYDASKFATVAPPMVKIQTFE